MPKYIIVNPKTGKAVQSWSFAERKHILYCTNPEWAMKFDKEDGAQNILDYLKKNFPGPEHTVLKVEFKTTVTIC